MATTFTAETNEGLIAHKKLIRALNRCIETCIDGEKGYGLAAADVRAPELKELFLSRAQQRGAFVLALQDVVRKLGATPENEGSIRGPLHRGLMSSVRTIEGRDDAIVMQGCLQGERYALRAYKAADALDHEDVPPEISAMIQAQYATIQEAHDDLFARLPHS